MVILSFGQTATEMGRERSLSGTTMFLTRPTEERGTPIHPVVRLCLGEEAIPELSQLETALRRFSPVSSLKDDYRQSYSNLFGWRRYQHRGLSTATGLADDRDEAGVYQWGRMTIKSGRGSITMNGTSSEYSGVGFTDPVTDTDSGTKQLIMKSAKTSGTAIQITGVSTSRQRGILQLPEPQGDPFSWRWSDHCHRDGRRCREPRRFPPKSRCPFYFRRYFCDWNCGRSCSG